MFVETTQTTGAPSAPTSPGSRAWQLMYDLFKANKPYMESVAATLDLTVQQMYALKQMDNERPLAMSELATLLGCDASNVTSIVDKLETRGFVARRSDERDRRVKALVMTPEGLALRERVEARMLTPPPTIGNLDVDDQLHLCRILERALGTTD